MDKLRKFFTACISSREINAEDSQVNSSESNVSEETSLVLDIVSLRNTTDALPVTSGQPNILPDHLIQTYSPYQFKKIRDKDEFKEPSNVISLLEINVFNNKRLLKYIDRSVLENEAVKIKVRNLTRDPENINPDFFYDDLYFQLDHFVFLLNKFNLYPDYTLQQYEILRKCPYIAVQITREDGLNVKGETGKFMIPLCSGNDLEFQDKYTLDFFCSDENSIDTNGIVVSKLLFEYMIPYKEYTELYEAETTDIKDVKYVLIKPKLMFKMPPDKIIQENMSKIRIFAQQIYDFSLQAGSGLPNFSQMLDDPCISIQYLQNLMK